MAVRMWSTLAPTVTRPSDVTTECRQQKGSGDQFRGRSVQKMNSDTVYKYHWSLILKFLMILNFNDD